MTYTFAGYFVDGWIMPEMPLTMMREPTRYPSNVDAVIIGHTTKDGTLGFYASDGCPTKCVLSFPCVLSFACVVPAFCQCVLSTTFV